MLQTQKGPVHHVLFLITAEKKTAFYLTVLNLTIVIKLTQTTHSLIFPEKYDLAEYINFRPEDKEATAAAAAAAEEEIP